MPSLSINYVAAIGPLLQVVISPPGFIPGATPPTFFMALIDTGASHTGITSKVITQLTLPPAGKQPVGGVHGLRATNIYHFQVGLAFPTGQPTPGGTISANIIQIPVVGAEFVSAGSFDGLLGRDVLCLGVLCMSFDGHAVFSI
jgi:hypothetical protein